MAAYGALVSLFNTMEQIKQHLDHARLPIPIDKEHIEPLSERVKFLIDFLECCHDSEGGSTKFKSLEARISDAVYAAREIIESNIASRLLLYLTSDDKERSSIFIRESVNNVIEEMDSIQKKAKEIEEVIKMEPLQAPNQECLQEYSASSSSNTHSHEKRSHVILKDRNIISDYSSKSPPIANNSLVGFDEYLILIMDWLMGQQNNQVTIPIVGMGGIGKTTLARNVFDNLLVVEYFYVRAWVTISQENNLRRVLLTILYSMRKQKSTETLEAFIDRMSRRSEDQLGEELYKYLCGMRYLIVLDDVWTIEAWDGVKVFFPDNGNGSRIVLTTRLSNVASYFGTCRLDMHLLDEDKSWSLLQERVFGHGDGCPLELVDVGKRISRICGGLPLSIVVLSGVLAKSKRTKGYWEYVAKNVKALVNSENDGHCLKILSLSYDHLPIHLKPCFLYMGVFPEDNEIYVPELIKLWIGEGFLKPFGAKSLEEIAEDCLKELIDRNLVLAMKRSSSQNRIKSCKMHDLLRDLCLKEARKEKFQHVTKTLNFDFPRQARDDDTPRAMTLLKDIDVGISREPCMIEKHSQGLLSKLINSRYIDFTRGHNLIRFPSSVLILWNLQTLIVRNTSKNTPVAVAPSEIWEMLQLRHVKFESVILPDPPGDRRECGVQLKNLQTLSNIRNFKCSEAVLKKIPNIKKLQICYNDFSGEFRTGNRYCLNKLKQLSTLESLSYSFFPERWKKNDLQSNIVFPSSLKKLTLYGFNLVWADMSRIINGSLPNLEVLKLRSGSLIGKEWNLSEGESFVSLKFLLIEGCYDLIHWRANETNFPSLVSLILTSIDSLEEIPSGFGEIPTLRSIKLNNCSDSAVLSAKNILEYQESFGIEELQVEVLLQYDTKLDISTSKSFLVRRW